MTPRENRAPLPLWLMAPLSAKGNRAIERVVCAAGVLQRAAVQGEARSGADAGTDAVGCEVADAERAAVIG